VLGGAMISLWVVGVGEARFLALIHPSAWKVNSRNFACWAFSEDEMRRPTPHTQYPEDLQRLTGSSGPERRIGPPWMVARTNRR
jgi:hypothetical protein